METNQAAEHLQVIRTLMERSALYRRALAPIMTYCGVVGIAAGIIGWQLKINSDRSFILFWSVVALLALTGAFMLVRRQAFKDSEPLWSPPTKRVAQALKPPLYIGCLINLVGGYMLRGIADTQIQIFFITMWVWFYGCAIHSAGFFIGQGIRWFGWIFIVSGSFLLIPALAPFTHIRPHFAMAILFGGLHLAYGIYLYFTENRKALP